MKDKIICLVGPSGSGKTTIAKRLEKQGYNIIHSYTTREQREDNEWGHTFVDKLPVRKTMALKMVEEIDFSNMIAFKEVYKGLYYWAAKEQYQGKGNSIYVVDPDGAKQVQESAKDAEVVTIFLMIDTDEKTRRLLVREGLENMKAIKYRLDKDIEIFKTCKCDYVVNANRKVNEVLKDITEIIESYDE